MFNQHPFGWDLPPGVSMRDIDPPHDEDWEETQDRQLDAADRQMDIRRDRFDDEEN